MAVGLLALAVLGLIATVVIPRAEGEKRLVVYPSAQYEPPTRLEDGADLQRVVLRSGERDVALGVRSYPNPRSLSAKEWLHAEWDPRRQIVTGEIQTRAGLGVAVLEAKEWLSTLTGETDFPVIAVLAVGPRIVVIDRLNGMEIDASLAFEILADVSAP